MSAWFKHRQMSVYYIYFTVDCHDNVGAFSVSQGCHQSFQIQGSPRRQGRTSDSDILLIKSILNS